MGEGGGGGDIMLYRYQYRIWLVLQGMHAGLIIGNSSSLQCELGVIWVDPGKDKKCSSV